MLLALPAALDAAVAPPALPEMTETSASGLKLTLRSGKASDARTARLIALHVPSGSRVSPFLEPDPFTATWDGTITLRIRGEYTFRAVGNGSIKVLINDQPALVASGEDLAKTTAQPVKISKGKTKIHVEYASPAKGDATVRLYWFEKTSPPEPVAPMVLSHEPSDVELRTQQRVREGRALFAELRCIKCHVPSPRPWPGVAREGEKGATSLAPIGVPGEGEELAMPELGQDAPDLSDAAARFGERWLAAWISDPKSLNPRAQMPRVFGDDKQAAADVAAFLMTLGKRPESVAPSQTLSIEQFAAGARLYTGLGCIACHTPPDHDGADDVKPARIPHKHVAAKYSSGSALGEFLKAPEARFKWSRMGNFRLSDQERETLVTYLYSDPRLKPWAWPVEFPTGDAARGKARFQSAGCLNCHTVKGVENATPPAAPQLAASEWAKGCVAADGAQRGKAPDFGLADVDRARLMAMAAHGVDSVQRDVALEFAERQVAQLNCNACHVRDKTDDTWSTLRPEIDTMLAKLPPEKIDKDSPHFGDQSRPPLTWIGEKLRPQWMEKFIAGEIAYKPRPWLLARMPSFAAQAHGLAVGLAHEHGYPSVAPENPAANPELAKVGQQLVAKTGGFSCIQCHDVADVKALSAFEAPAPNFAYTAERLNHDYYTRWMLKPQKVQPGTRMPDYADAEAKTSLKSFYGGDAHQQFEAVWQYLLTAPNIEPPTTP